MTKMLLMSGNLQNILSQDSHDNSRIMLSVSLSLRRKRSPKILPQHRTKRQQPYKKKSKVRGQRESAASIKSIRIPISAAVRSTHRQDTTNRTR